MAHYVNRLNISIQYEIYIHRIRLVEEAYQLTLRAKEKLSKSMRKRPIPRGVESSVQIWRGGVIIWGGESSSWSDISVGYQ